MPITGPFSTFIDINGLRDSKYWYRSTRPYHAPMNFDRLYLFGKQMRGFPLSPFYYNMTSSPLYSFLQEYGGGDVSDLVEQCYRSAYDKFSSKIKYKHHASLGVSLAEVGESVAMIAARSRNMLLAATALRKGRLGDLYDALFLKEKIERRKAKTVMQRYQATGDFAKSYLELVFGWRPLLQDIGDAINILQDQNYRSGTVNARSSGQKSFRSTLANADGITIHNKDYQFFVQVGGRVSVSNPNVALANELGFVNPLQVAWDVIPFSFLVNYFLPVSQFLESYSTLWGFNCSDCYVTHFRRANSTSSGIYVQWPDYNNDFTEESSGFSVHRQSVPSLSPPSFSSRVRLPGGDLLGKASTSVALLVQSLSKR